MSGSDMDVESEINDDEIQDDENEENEDSDTYDDDDDDEEDQDDEDEVDEEDQDVDEKPSQEKLTSKSKNTHQIKEDLNLMNLTKNEDIEKGKAVKKQLRKITQNINLIF